MKQIQNWYAQFTNSLTKNLCLKVMVNNIHEYLSQSIISHINNTLFKLKTYLQLLLRLHGSPQPWRCLCHLRCHCGFPHVSSWQLAPTAEVSPCQYCTPIHIPDHCDWQLLGLRIHSQRSMPLQSQYGFPKNRSWSWQAFQDCTTLWSYLLIRQPGPCNIMILN